jgi:tetratricopeptide (TPR) repeat protein
MSTAEVDPGAGETGAGADAGGIGSAGTTEALASPAVDQGNPWLGLASFTEETRAFFYGRDDEVAELARRVQRKLLTILFGQSGLGKTSILRAGLVPRLRDQGYCPVYVRIDYDRHTPEPAEQIKQAIRRAASGSGEWTQAGVATDRESLWEFLHHRGDVLRDSSGTTLIPLLIFDQFEEIFTLAQSDDFGRARAARFIEELADLVENRPPKALEKQLDVDDSAAERFDFARSDYRVLIALREDYLAPLESLKKSMPGISQNRLRLAPMTGTQALSAVVQPGGRLVTEEVAAAIVRFVAGGAELANAEVEPSLLSLICRELNDARIAQGRSEISLDLLAGSHATILSNFYERVLADQPTAVRRIVEDDLLTDSGFRENVAEENLVRRFAAAGAAPDTLAVLVNRRLLRVEERLDVRRVELTHDVLCAVVKSSRDRRKERESRDATERLLEEQRTRELAARKAMVRARQIASICTVLAIVAVAAAVFAYFNGQRARRAEQEALETRTAAMQARNQAENLLGYLSDDFVRELENFGRLNLLAEFSQRQIDYFHALPPGLKGIETSRNGALAMVHHARAMRALGNLSVGTHDAAEAEQLLEGLRAAGDHSEATLIALALAYNADAQILDSGNEVTGAMLALRAVNLLQPAADSPGASPALRRAYVEVLVRLGYEQLHIHQDAAVIPTEQKAMRLAIELGAKDFSNIDMGALYAAGAAWLVEALSNIGHNDEARRAGEDAMQVADKVLEKRPGYRMALQASQSIESNLTDVAQNDLNPAEAVRFSERGEQALATLLQLDPNNVASMNSLGHAYQARGSALWSQGRLQESIDWYLKELDAWGHATAGGEIFLLARACGAIDVSYHQGEIGDVAGAEATIASGRPYFARLRASFRQNTFSAQFVQVCETLPETELAYDRDDLPAAERGFLRALEQMRAAAAVGDFQVAEKLNATYFTAHLVARTQLERGEPAAAERSERQALDARNAAGAQSVSDRREVGESRVWLAMAVARQGRLAEAAELIAPVVAFQRELALKNHGDQWLPFELACALYAQSLTDDKRRPALLREAAALLDRLPPQIRSTHDVRKWRGWVQQARKMSAGPPGRAGAVAAIAAVATRARVG